MKNTAYCIIIFLTATLLAGCRTGSYVAAPDVSIDSVYVDRWRRDSIYVLDSVFVDRWAQGDTVFVEKNVTRYEYKDRWRYDTISVMRADTISVPYPVEKELTIWQRLRLGTWYVLAVSVAVLSLVVFILKRGKQ